MVYDIAMHKIVLIHICVCVVIIKNIELKIQHPMASFQKLLKF